jgi:hypothetical protein
MKEFKEFKERSQKPEFRSQEAGGKTPFFWEAADFPLLVTDILITDYFTFIRCPCLRPSHYAAPPDSWILAPASSPRTP